MGQNFWSLKQHVESWLASKGITYCSVVGLGKGHHGVEMYIHGETSAEFIEKHGRSFETPHYKGCLTTDRYPYKVYISMVQNRERKVYK